MGGKDRSAAFKSLSIFSFPSEKVADSRSTNMVVSSNPTFGDSIKKQASHTSEVMYGDGNEVLAKLTKIAYAYDSSQEGDEQPCQASNYLPSDKTDNSSNHVSTCSILMCSNYLEHQPPLIICDMIISL